MANKRQSRVLSKLLGKKVCLQGKFDRGDRERLVELIEAQQGTVAEDLDATVDFLVLPDLSAGKTMRKKAQSLNAKGAAIQVQCADAFKMTIEPTREQVLELIRSGKESAAIFAKAVGTVAYRYHRAAQAAHWTFTGENFDGADLSGFEFGDVAFQECRFVNTVLNGTSFLTVNQCDFSGATGEQPTFGDVHSSRFVGARFKGGIFHSHLAGCDFTDAVLEGVTFSENFWGSRVAGKKRSAGVIFRGATLKSGQFLSVRLESPDFIAANLRDSTFSECDLKSAKFIKANFVNAILIYCEMPNADFMGADLSRANLAYADLTEAIFDDADLSGCNLRGAKINRASFSKTKNYAPTVVTSGTVGPALTELNTLAQNAKRIEVEFHVRTEADDEGEEVGLNSAHLKYGAGIRLPPALGNRRHVSGTSFSDAILEMANLLGQRKVRFETVEVSSTKAAKGGKDLRELALVAISEAFAQPLPPAEELAKATKAWREHRHEQGAADRERREKAKLEAEKQKAAEKKKAEKAIQKQVGKVTDIATFLKVLELRADKQKIDKATKMLRASRFQLFTDVTDDHLNGVVKSQTDPDLVYACRIESDGKYACCTQNLNICGGLRGSICKHLLVLIVGLVKAGELDPTTIDGWVAKSNDVKPELNKETMGDIFIRYKGAEAGEVDWRPTETVPEDYYSL